MAFEVCLEAMWREGGGLGKSFHVYIRALKNSEFNSGSQQTMPPKRSLILESTETFNLQVGSNPSSDAGSLNPVHSVGTLLDTGLLRLLGLKGAGFHFDEPRVWQIYIYILKF